MHDLLESTGSLALDPAGPAAGQSAPAVGPAGSAADPAGAAGAVGTRLSHPPNRVRPMHDLLESTGSLALDPAGLAAGLAGAAWVWGVWATARPGSGRHSRKTQVTRIRCRFHGQVLQMSQRAVRVCCMNDLPNPSEALALDPAGPVADPTDPATDQPGLAADPAGEAGCRAGDAEGLSLPAGGRAMLGDGLAGGRAAGVADGPAGTHVQSGQLGSRSIDSNGCDCHILLIGCAT